jgi:hypothetical protein
LLNNVSLALLHLNNEAAIDAIVKKLQNAESGTNLANAGGHPKTAQTLARHRSITLTMDRNSHALQEQEAEALGVLSDLAPSSRDAICK